MNIIKLIKTLLLAPVQLLYVIAGAVRSAVNAVSPALADAIGFDSPDMQITGGWFFILTAALTFVVLAYASATTVYIFGGLGILAIAIGLARKVPVLNKLWRVITFQEEV